MSNESAVEPNPAANTGFIVALVAGAAVAVLLGVYGRVHDPASETTIKLFFTGTLHFKAWATTLVLVFAIAQVVLAAWMWGRLPGAGDAPEWVGPAHRLSGMLALIVSLPVAYHCLWSLGFDPEPSGGRRLVHSIVGCALYGAFVTKVMIVRRHSGPAWGLPVVGGVLFALFVLVWWTSSLWFFTEIGVEL